MLTSRDNGTLLLAAIRAVTWIAWACFTLSALVEAVSRVQGRPAPRLPLIAPVQGLAAALIGAAILSSIPFPHGPRPLPQPARPAQATAAAPPRPAGPLQAVTTAMTLRAARSATADGAGAPGGQNYRRYEVADGDDLWDIAGRFLGDPEEWHQIFRLNEGRAQPDGQALTDPDLILPGWILLIPEPPGHSGPAPHPVRPARPHRGQSPARSQPALAGRHTHRAAAPAPPPRRPARIRTPAPGRSRCTCHQGAIIGIAVAVMVAAAAALAGIQRRRRYRPRLTARLRPAPPPAPSVITTLRRAARPRRLRHPRRPRRRPRR